jgi:hypothetical protein
MVIIIHVMDKMFGLSLVDETREAKARIKTHKEDSEVHKWPSTNAVKAAETNLVTERFCRYCDSFDNPMDNVKVMNLRF